MKRLLNLFKYGLEAIVIAILIFIFFILLDVGIAASKSTDNSIHFGITNINGAIVTSSSMEGGIDLWSDKYDNHIYAGDAILIKKVKSPNEINVGDVITFFKDYDESSVTHRVISKKLIDGKYEFQTRGDANNSQDNWVVYEDNIAGKYILRIPKCGYISQVLIHFFNNNIVIIIGLFAIAIVSLLVYIVFCIIKWIAVGEDDKGSEEVK